MSFKEIKWKSKNFFNVCLIFGGTSGKEFACQCRRCKRRIFNPWVWKIPRCRKWQPTPVFLPRKFHGQKSLVGYSLMGSQRVGHNWECTHRYYYSLSTHKNCRRILLHALSAFYGTKVTCLIVWPPDWKNWLIGKDPDPGKDWRREEKGMTEDDMGMVSPTWVWAVSRSGDGQGSMACCSL